MRCSKSPPESGLLSFYKSCSLTHHLFTRTELTPSAGHQLATEARHQAL
nr:MAG TPA: hypothetical protein [Caudoviricetes sp.]